MSTVFGIVRVIVLIAGAILILVVAIELIGYLVDRIRSKTKAADSGGDPGLQKTREAAAKLSNEHFWLDPDVLEQDGLFEKTVAELSRPEVDSSLAIKAAKSTFDFEMAIGFAAIAARGEIPSGQTDWMVRTLGRCPGPVERFVFRALAAHAEYPVIGPALSQLDDDISWLELAQFIAARRADREEITA